MTRKRERGNLVCERGDAGGLNRRNPPPACLCLSFCLCLFVSVSSACVSACVSVCFCLFLCVRPSVSVGLHFGDLHGPSIPSMLSAFICHQQRRWVCSWVRVCVCAHARTRTHGRTDGRTDEEGIVRRWGGKRERERETERERERERETRKRTETLGHDPLLP